MRLYYPIILLFISISFSIKAQNCSEVSDWMDVIKNEHPNLKVNTFIPRNTVENLAVNLYSDKYFVPFRGKSFSGLSEKARTKDWRKIQSCYIKNGYQSIPYKAWVFNNIIYNYQIDFRSDAFGIKIVARNALRDELSKELKLLANGQLGYDAVQTLRANLSSKYAVLFPSEIETALSKVNENESISADKMLLEKTDIAKNLPKTKVSLEALLNFESVNRELYTKASKQTKTQVNRDIESKTKDLVDYLMPKEVLKLAGTKSTDANAQKINKLIADFKKDYSQVLHIESAQHTLQLFRKRKTEIVSNMKSWLEMGIENAKTEKELTTLADLILSDLDENSKTYKELFVKFETKRISIAQEKDRIANAKRLKYENAQRQFNIEADKRQIAVAKLQSEVNTLRQKLNVKYNNNLLKYDDLINVLNAYLKLVRPDQKYERADADAFMKKVRNLGFVRITNGKISDYMDFENSYGHTLVCIGFSEDSYASVILSINNVSEDVKTLYEKDIRANYRNRLKPFKTPDEKIVQSEYFVKSGATLYNYKTNDNWLTISANSNYGLKNEVATETIGPQTWKVGSFSNYTTLYLREGDIFTLKCSGTIKVGSFLGNSSPEGIKALKIYNYDQRFPHGSLIGKIGRDGEYFFVGKGGRFKASTKGSLHLRINDRLLQDNTGFYTVEYERE